MLGLAKYVKLVTLASNSGFHNSSTMRNILGWPRALNLKTGIVGEGEVSSIDEQEIESPDLHSVLYG